MWAGTGGAAERRELAPQREEMVVGEALRAAGRIAWGLLLP